MGHTTPIMRGALSPIPEGTEESSSTPASADVHDDDEQASGDFQHEDPELQKVLENLMVPVGEIPEIPHVEPLFLSCNSDSLMVDMLPSASHTVRLHSDAELAEHVELSMPLWLVADRELDRQRHRDDLQMVYQLETNTTRRAVVQRDDDVLPPPLS